MNWAKLLVSVCLFQKQILPSKLKLNVRALSARFETYIANLNVIINSGDELASEMRKARVKRLYSALDENEKEDIKALLN